MHHGHGSHLINHQHMAGIDSAPPQDLRSDETSKPGRQGREGSIQKAAQRKIGFRLLYSVLEGMEQNIAMYILPPTYLFFVQSRHFPLFIR